jgi:hypothetical protein
MVVPCPDPDIDDPETGGSLYGSSAYEQKTASVEMAARRHAQSIRLLPEESSVRADSSVGGRRRTGQEICRRILKDNSALRTLSCRRSEVRAVANVPRVPERVNTMEGAEAPVEGRSRVMIERVEPRTPGASSASRTSGRRHVCLDPLELAVDVPLEGQSCDRTRSRVGTFKAIDEAGPLECRRSIDSARPGSPASSRLVGKTQCAKSSVLGGAPTGAGQRPISRSRRVDHPPPNFRGKSIENGPIAVEPGVPTTLSEADRVEQGIRNACPRRQIPAHADMGQSQSEAC